MINNDTYFNLIPYEKDSSSKAVHEDLKFYSLWKLILNLLYDGPLFIYDLPKDR